MYLLNELEKYLINKIKKQGPNNIFDVMQIESQNPNFYKIEDLEINKSLMNTTYLVNPICLYIFVSYIYIKHQFIHFEFNNFIFKLYS